MKRMLLSLCLIMGVFFQDSIFAQPANDNCADAIAIGEVSDEVFSNFSATTDGADHADDCPSGGTTPAVTYNDIWYLYTSTVTGEVEWSFCSTASFDTKIYVYDGTAACPPGDDDIIACNEDTGGCDDATSVAVFDAIAGNTYLLRVGGYGDGLPGATGSGTFNLGEYIPAIGPPNNNCADAEVIGFVTDFPFTNDDASTDGPEHPANPCFGFGDNTVQADVWYSFTAPVTGAAEWSTCNMTTLDTRLAVYTGTGVCPYTDADLYACNDDGGGCADFTSQLIFDIVEGETYLLRLGGFNGNTGDGFMSLVDIVPPEPPANDLCSEPEEVYVISKEDADNFNPLFYGSTIASSFDNDQFIFPKCIGNTNGGEFGDVWYTFNTEGNTELEIRFNSETENAQYYFDIWDSCDTTATFETIMSDCSFFDGSLGFTYFQDTITGLPDVPTVYYVRIMTRFTSDIPGDYWFQIVGENVGVAVEELQLEELAFYPNPANESASLKFNLTQSGLVDFEITNILGQSVIQENKGMLTSGEYNFPISLANLDPGIYLLSIRMDNKVKTLKFVRS